MESAVQEISQLGVPVVTAIADCGDDTALRAALDSVAARLGPPEVAVYNAAVIRPDRIGELSATEQVDTWSVNVMGALTAGAHLLPAMAQRGSGSFLVTGGMPTPKREYVSLSLGKAGLRTVVALLDQEYGSAGVHVACVTVDGPVAPGTDFDPVDIAEHYWRLHTQPRPHWTQEIIHSGKTEG
jgi:NAD(P)-dependent dehydrogenase (short-subunit alcohol dehydrogenase family)